MFPAELTTYPQWVMWRFEPDDKGKPTKVPYAALSPGTKASSADSRTWCDYQSAIQAYETGWYAGVGFVLTDLDPYCMIDLDDPEGNPVVIDRHYKLIQMMDSYTEWSPSGKGMHVIVRGKVPTGRHKDKMGVFSSKRYMTMTGNTFLDKPIEDRSEILPMFFADLAPREPIQATETAELEDDFTIYERMMGAANGDKALATWNGQWEGVYTSHSECDIALVNMIQFYSKNKAQIKRIFFASPNAQRIVTGQKKKSRTYVDDLINKSFDRELPPIDISKLRASAEKHFAKKVHVTTKKVPPLEWENPPGLLGEITQFIYEAAPLPVREIALAGAFAMVAGIVGRAYNVADKGLNIYMLALALTGVGKEAAASGISILMGEIEKVMPAAKEFRGPAEIASGPALTKHLANKAPSCFSMMGEFGLRMHQMCAENAQGNQVGIRRVLLDLYEKSGKHDVIQAHVYSDKDKNTDVLYSPAFSILGESTPGTFYDHLDESMIVDGLLPRFIVIEYKGHRVYLNRDRKIKASNQLIQKLTELATYCIQLHSAKRVLDCSFTPEAQALNWKLSDEYTDRINEAGEENEVARQLLNRAHMKIMKLSALIAVGVNPIYPTITVDYMMWAKRLVDHDAANIMHRFQTGMVGRQTGDLSQAAEMTKIIKHYIERPYDTTMAKYLVMPEMHAAFVVPLQYIMRTAGSRASFRQDRAGSTLAIKRALETLQHEGAIREMPSHIVARTFGDSKRMKAYAVIDPTFFA